MLETIREFALEQLEAAGEMESLRHQLAAFFLGMAEEADSQILGPGQLAWLERLELDNDNLRAALTWSMSETADENLAGRLAASLFWFWLFRGHVTEMRDWLTRALTRLGNADDPRLRARLLTWLGAACWQQADFAAAREQLTASLDICRQIGATRELGFVLFFLGNVAIATGDPEQAEYRYEESLQAFRECGDAWGPSIPLMGLGRVALLRGDVEAGRTFLEESLAIRRRLRETWGLAQVLNSLGDVARRQGDYERARELYEEGLEQFRSLGSRPSMAGLLHNLGYVSLYQRENAQACAFFAEALTLFREAGDKRGVAECLAGLAAVAAAKNQPTRAARLFGASEALLEAIGSRLSPSNVADYERNLAAARASIDEAAFAAAWSEGRSLSVDQAIARGLAETDAS